LQYKEALRKSIIKKIIGVAIAVPSIISTVISILRMMYFRMDDGSMMGGIISKPLKQFVYFVYENTGYLEWFWENSPIPNFMHLKDEQNLYFLLIYFSFFVGVAFYASGSKLSLRLKKINEQIEEQIIKDSIEGQQSRSREEIENNTEIPQSSIFSQFHQLYLAPIITAIIATLILKLIGF